jgi:hypothetical protein
MKSRRVLLAITLSWLALSPWRVAVAAPVTDPEHRMLATLVGDWAVKQSLWTTGNAAPKVDAGRATFSLVLDGHELQQKLTIDDGTGFEGLGYLGFDQVARQFFSTWMDVNFTGIVVAEGAFDPATRTYVLRGSMSAQGGKRIPVREVITVDGPDHFSYAYFETHGGNEALAVKLDYKRVN